MAYKPAKSDSPARQGYAPAEALRRPAGLKAWSSDLVGILQKERDSLFQGWTFAPGSLTRMDFTRILKKISGCGSVVELRAALDRQTGEVGEPVVHAANYCGQHTICPYCAGRVQDRRGARFREPIELMARTYPYAYMLTATIPPVETWREDLDQLISGWQSFRRMGQIRRRKKKDGTVVEKRSGGEWGKIRAGLAKVELKRGEGSGLPHCHYHALVFTDEMIDFRLFENERIKAAYYAGDPEARPLHTLPDGRMTTKINMEWWKATGGRATNLEVSPIRYLKKHKAKGLSYSESVFEQSREVLKYATKFDSSPETGAEALFARDFVGIRDATYSRRLFSTYGDFRSVGGDDFKGGGPHFSERPLIYESRWRRDRYAPLVERDKPIFPNTDVTPGATARLIILNRVQGGARRVRTAIINAKNHFMQTRQLAPAGYLKRTYLEGGGFTEAPVVMETPAHVAADPANPETWETWLDEVMERARAYYAEVKETLELISREAIIGTKEERAAAEYREWLASVKAKLKAEGYIDRIAAAFFEVLNAPGKMLPYPAPP